MKTRISEDILRSLIRKKLLSEAPRNPLDQAIKDDIRDINPAAVNKNLGKVPGTERNSLHAEDQQLNPLRWTGLVGTNMTKPVDPIDDKTGLTVDRWYDVHGLAPDGWLDDNRGANLDKALEAYEAELEAYEGRATFKFYPERKAAATPIADIGGAPLDDEATLNVKFYKEVLAEYITSIGNTTAHTEIVEKVGSDPDNPKNFRTIDDLRFVVEKLLEGIEAILVSGDRPTSSAGVYNENSLQGIKSKIDEGMKGYHHAAGDTGIGSLTDAQVYQIMATWSGGDTKRKVAEVFTTKGGTIPDNYLGTFDVNVIGSAYPSDDGTEVNIEPETLGLVGTNTKGYIENPGDLEAIHDNVEKLLSDYGLPLEVFNTLDADDELEKSVRKGMLEFIASQRIVAVQQNLNFFQRNYGKQANLFNDIIMRKKADGDPEIAALQAGKTLYEWMKNDDERLTITCIKLAWGAVTLTGTSGDIDLRDIMEPLAVGAMAAVAVGSIVGLARMLPASMSAIASGGGTSVRTVFSQAFGRGAQQLAKLRAGGALATSGENAGIVALSTVLGKAGGILFAAPQAVFTLEGVQLGAGLSYLALVYGGIGLIGTQLDDVSDIEKAINYKFKASDMWLAALSYAEQLKDKDGNLVMPGLGNVQGTGVFDWEFGLTDTDAGSALGVGGEGIAKYSGLVKRGDRANIMGMSIPGTSKVKQAFSATLGGTDAWYLENISRPLGAVLDEIKNAIENPAERKGLRSRIIGLVEEIAEVYDMLQTGEIESGHPALGSPTISAIDSTDLNHSGISQAWTGQGLKNESIRKTHSFSSGKIKKLIREAILEILVNRR